MSDKRTLSPKNKYYVPKETFLMVVHYCKQYPGWEAELSAMSDTSKGIAYDQDRVQASVSSDPTFELAVRREEISKKKDMIDKTAKEVAGNLWKWMILGACYDHPYYHLRHCGIPCGKDVYYALRRKFYFEMSKKI